ncbi:MAG: hypothetical protein BWY70_00652 [Bacteroidetes bacterium ADurb.Bin408]|nr:MAG: hypothetical protein BWY70_00652 [Bacteroidetes bacterium ADurb.Bin408]
MRTLRYIQLFVFIFLISLNLSAQDDSLNNQINTYFNPARFPNGIKNIKIYTKYECGKCRSIMEEIKKYNIPHTEFDLHDEAINSAIDSRVYRLTPNKNVGYTLSYPIIEIDSVIFYCLPDHYTFVRDLYNFLNKDTLK